MCNCMKELEEDKEGLVAAFVERRYKGSHLERINFDGVAFPMSRDNGAVKIRCVTYSTMKADVDKRTRPASVTVLHSFCPFCGGKHE